MNTEQKSENIFIACDCLSSFLWIRITLAFFHSERKLSLCKKASQSLQMDSPHLNLNFTINFSFRKFFIRTTNEIRRKFTASPILFTASPSLWLRPLKPLVPLPAARRAQRVNDEPVNVLNLLFFVYFI